jgi:lysophospholipase L1-like esterase
MKKRAAVGLLAGFFLLTEALSSNGATIQVHAAALTPTETLGALLRRVSATVNYPTPVLSGATAWRADATYAAPGIEVSNGGKVYRLTVAGKSAGAGGPAGAGAAISDNPVTWAYVGRQTAPTVGGDVTKNPITPTVEYRTYTNSQYFTPYGGSNLFYANFSSRCYSASTGININGNARPGTSTTTGLSALGCGEEWETDSLHFAIRTSQGTPGYNFAIYIDDKLVSTSTFSSSFGGDANFFEVDWRNVPGAVKGTFHRYRFENGAFAMDMYGVELGPLDKIRAVAATPVSMACIGDSITAGTGLTQGDVSFVDGGYCEQLGKMLGAQPCASGVGGSGYVALGAPGPSIPQRITSFAHGGLYQDLSICRQPLNIILNAAGINDGGRSPSTIAAAVTGVLQEERQQCPTCLIVTLGPWWNNRNTQSNQNVTEAAILAGWTATDVGNQGKLSWFVPTVNPQAKFTKTGVAYGYAQFMKGAGTTVAPTGLGNTDIYMGPLAPHPNNAGHKYLASRLSQILQTQIIPFVP